MQSVIIIGGDRRQSYLKEIFTENDLFCRHINSLEENRNLERISQYDVVMLPVPISKDGEHIYSYNDILLIKIEDVIDNIKSGQKVLGAGINEEIKSRFDEKGIKFVDLNAREDFVLYNAYLTAQGALKLLVDCCDELLASKKALITGYGRVGKALSQLLKACGVDVYVAARDKTQLLEARCKGCKAMEISSISHCIHFFDFIFNTVPSAIFSREDVSHISGKYFELASKPFGADKKYFKENTYVDAGSLPGKFTARSAAEKIAEISLEHI